MQCGTHSKHFPTHQMRIRPSRHITEDIKISILPTVPIGLMQNVRLLLRKLGTSLFHKRWKCLNLTKRDSDDYLGVALVVNDFKLGDDFKLGELLADNFKCLIFSQGLVSAKDAEIRRRVLSKLENEPDLTLQKLAEDCQRIVSIRKD